MTEVAVSMWSALRISAIGVSMMAMGGCAGAGAGDAMSASGVFVYTRADLEAEIRVCRRAPTEDCRNDLIYVAKAHVDAGRLADSGAVDWWSKAFALAFLAGSTATARVSGENAKTNVSTGLAVLAGIRQIFDFGEDERKIHSSDVWERIAAKMNLPLREYPLQAALADLEEYRVVGAGE